MENLSSYEGSFFSQNLAEFLSTMIAARRVDNPVHTYFSDFNDFSWENFIVDQKYNVLPVKSCLGDDISSLFEYDENVLVRKTRALKAKELNDEFIVRSGTNAKDVSSIVESPSSECHSDGLLPHELLVKGTFVHPNIVPGFCYTVRRLNGGQPLFNGKALCLERLGMGYGKRITFAGPELHDNDNHFWSDTNPDGYGFSLELVHVEDKFTVLDFYNNPIGTVEVESLMEPQNEIEDSINSKNKSEKRATVSLRCKINYFDETVFSEDTVNVTGVAVSSKKNKSRGSAVVTKVKDCFINLQSVTLVPSTIKDIQRTRSLNGENVSNVPEGYNITGLHRNELAVIGTFVDPRITPGFKYKVRVLNSKRHLFEGEALTLLSIGRGYGKRITFAGKSLKNNDNYFYSDTQPDGYGFTMEAVSEGNSFRVVDCNGYAIGEARVFKLCGAQVEMGSNIQEGIITKTVSVSFACHILLDEEMDGITTRVNGLAHVESRKGPSSVQRITDLEFVNLFNSQNCNLSSVFACVKM